MTQFSYLFSAEPNAPFPSELGRCLSSIFKRGRLRPSNQPVLVKAGFLEECGFLDERLSMGQLQHYLDTSNPWRDAHAKSVMSSAHWKGRPLLICTFTGLKEKRAKAISLALESYQDFICVYPWTGTAACEHLLQSSLFPIVAFHRFSTASSGVLHLQDLLDLGLPRPVYKDPELFFSRHEVLQWAGLPSEGDTRPTLFD